MPREAARETKIFYGVWIVLAAFILFFLTAGAGFYSFSVFIKPLEDAFGWHRASVALAMSIFLMTQGICGTLIGYLTERYGPKRVMTVSAVVSGAVFISVAFTHALWYFYLTYALLAVALTGVGFIPVSSLLARWFVRRRGTAIGFSMVGIAMGGFIMSPLVGMLNAHFSWRWSYVLLGLMAWFLAVPMTLFVIKASPSEIGLRPDGDIPEELSDQKLTESGVVASAEEEGWPFREALRTRAFWWVAVTYLLAPMAQGGVLQHQVPVVCESGIAATAAAMALGITAGMGGLGKLCFGRLSESVSFRYVAGFCFGLQAVSILLLLTVKSLAAVWIYVVLYGFGMGGIVVLMPLAVGHYFGVAAFGTIMGVVALIQAIGSSSGAYISGLIYDAFGNYTYALILFGTIYVVAIGAIFMAGRPKAYVIDGVIK